MAGTSQNIIRKQTVDFQYNGNAEGFALQKEVHDWCRFMLMPEIEEQLELFDVGDDYIVIDKLEIDAVIEKKDWQQKIRSELISNLSIKLRDYKPAVKNTTGQQKQETRKHKLDELILFYFEKGYLPWWSKAFVESYFETLLLNWITEDKSTVRNAHIIAKLRQINSGPVIQRIVNQVAGHLFFNWLKNIFKSEHETISEAEFFLKQVLEVACKSEQKQITAEIFQQALLSLFIKEKGKIDIELGVKIFYAGLKHNNGRDAVVLQALHGKTLAVENPFIRYFQKTVTEQATQPDHKTNKAEKDENQLNYNQLIDQLRLENAPAKIKEQVAADLREGIYIENAGAVIIAAFLPTLFARLKIAANDIVVKPDLAALMVQYVVSGKTKTAEHELLLPKILCGISPELPVNTNKRISALQKNEADEMLKSVIEHWAVLGSTSADGLRESFLKRSGKLIQVDDEWLLQVEQKSFDMLLQQLPWNISMIKLPWMNHLLKTEWV